MGVRHLSPANGPLLGLSGIVWDSSAVDLFLLCAFLSASLLGVVLAFFSDEVSSGSLRWSFIAMQLLPLPPLSAYVAHKEVESALAKAATRETGRDMAIRQLRAAVQQGNLWLLLTRWGGLLFEKLRFYWWAIKLRYTAESKRHFMYQMHKYRLQLPIRKGETEMQSYNDTKRHMKARQIWPFAYEVSYIKEERIICQGRRAYPMSSYSYLDFIREPLVQEAAVEAGRAWATGNHGARMLGGNARILRDLERVVGWFFGRKDSLVCATGFLAAMSGVCAVAKQGDLIVGDSRLHASLRAGIQLCGAKSYTFRHNNWRDLQLLLCKYRRKYKKCWILVESVYSMDGDIAHLPTVRKLADQYNCRILVDEAHGLGVLGKTGRGLEEHFNMPYAADVIVGTFSKSIAGVGGYIVGDDELVEYLDFHAPGSVFSAPLTSYSAGGAIKAFELMQGEQSWRIQKAQLNATYLRRALETGNGHWPVHYPADCKYEVEGMECTTVIPVVYRNDAYRLCLIAHQMLQRGWMLAAAVYPACPLNRPRFRVTATAAYTKDVMDNFVKDLVEVTVACEPTKVV